MSSKRAINAMIGRWGEVVTVMPRTATVNTDTGAPVFTFPHEDQFRIKSLVYDASGLREEWYVIGRGDEVDYLASFPFTIAGKINPMDRVELANGILTIVDFVIERGRGPAKDYLEVLLKRSE